MTQIRLVEEGDVERVAQLYRDVYGEDYPFKEFYDTEWIKRGVYDRSIRWFVAAEPDGRLLGSAAVMLAAGDHDDQVSELGRLVVHPDARGKGIASSLVGAITKEADRVSDFAFAECRTAHVGSQVIFSRFGFGSVGIEPLVYRLGDHESVIFVCRVSEAARALRRTAPVVIPQAFVLAAHALTNCAVDVDVSPAVSPDPYPVLRGRDDIVLEDMNDRQKLRLLRLSRNNLLHPDVFGSCRLEHGHLKLKQHNARYLVLRSGEQVLGGLGYAWDQVDRKIKVFELTAIDDQTRGTLIHRAVMFFEDTLDARYISVDVNAHSTRMQQSLHQLGFAPVCYKPSMVYVLGERFDVLTMVKLRQEPRLGHWKLIEACERAAHLGEAAVLAVTRGTEVGKAIRALQLFDELTDMQLAEVSALCHEQSFEENEVIFELGSEEQSLHLLVEGQVQLTHADGATTSIEAGGTFGELGLLDGGARQVKATTQAPTQVLVIEPTDFDQLVACDTSIGVVLLRNLARTLGSRVRKRAE